jgi:hypothetical protein
MAYPSVEDTGEEKLHFLQSYLLGCFASDCLTLDKCRAAISRRPAPTSLSDLKASSRCSRFRMTKFF